MATKNIVLPIALSVFDSSAMTGSYQLLSAAGGIPAACIMLRFVNDSTQDIFISYDGVTDHDFLPGITSFELNFQANAQPTPSVSCMPLGTKIYVKGTAGAGFIYLSGYYNPQGV